MPEDKNNKRNNRKGNDSAEKISPAEWIIGSIGLLIFLFSFGYILYLALTSNKTPPRIKINVESIIPNENNFVVQINVENSGSSTAEGLVVQGELLGGGGSTVEVSRTTFDYVPEKSKRKGGMIFTKDPRKYNFSIRALGYEEP